MKTHFTRWIGLLILTFSLTACRTVRERKYHMQEEQAATVAKQHQQYRYAQQYRDSSMQYWLFASDSLFYFHPKDGLWSTGGSLLFGHESKVWQQVAHTYAQHDSQSTAVSLTTDRMTVRKDRSSWKGWMLILATGLAAVCTLWLWIRWKW